MNIIQAKAWADEMDIMLTVCDLNGTIVYMNQTSVMGFHKYGGAELIGKSLFNCHLPQSQLIIKNMLEFPQVNTHIIHKNNERRLIRMFPWIEKGEHKGLIELNFEIPDDISEH